MTEARPELPGSWQRAVLPLLLLSELQQGRRHGYALGKALQQRGLDPVKGATLYPALAKLEERGEVAASWEEGSGGPGRKVYELTGRGREALAHYLLAFDRLTRIVVVQVPESHRAQEQGQPG